MLHERDEQHGKPLDAAQRAIFEALLKRRSEENGEDNPPLTILFDLYYVERKLPVKTKTEWEGICTRFMETVGIDLPVRSLTQAHIRNFKTGMLTNASKRTGQPVAPVTVKKVLSALRAVLAWGKSEGYLTANVADGITVVGTLKDREDGRQPYSAEDLATLFSRDACLARSDNEARKRRSAGVRSSVPSGTDGERPADTWLPFLALYTGARLEELGQLRLTDVREEDGIPFLAIELGDGKRLKTRSSRRRIPIHPDLIRLGFLTFVESRRALPEDASVQRSANHARLFPELTAPATAP
jgi:integrase